MIEYISIPPIATHTHTQHEFSKLYVEPGNTFGIDSLTITYALNNKRSKENPLKSNFILLFMLHVYVILSTTFVLLTHVTICIRLRRVTFERSARSMTYTT